MRVLASHAVRGSSRHYQEDVFIIAAVTLLHNERVAGGLGHGIAVSVEFPLDSGGEVGKNPVFFAPLFQAIGFHDLDISEFKQNMRKFKMPRPCAMGVNELHGPLNCLPHRE